MCGSLCKGLYTKTSVIKRVKIKIAFYKGEGNYLNSIVRWWTKSIYSHAELVLPDGVTWVGISPFLKSKVASRKKLIIDPSEWDFIALDVTQVNCWKYLSISDRIL